jgi:hypothetical protein
MKPMNITSSFSKREKSLRADLVKQSERDWLDR